MNWDTLLDPTFSTRFCLTLLHSFWQMTLLTVLAWITDRLFRRRSVARSYVLHVVAFVTGLLLLPATYLIVDVAPPAAVGNVPSVASTDPSAAIGVATWPPSPDIVQPTDHALAGVPNDRDQEPRVSTPLTVISPNPVIAEVSNARWPVISTWILGLYALGVLAMFIRLCLGLWQANRLAATAKPLRDGPIAALLQSLVREMSLRTVPAIAIAERIVVPQVVGLLRPMILLPASVATGLSAEELRLILAHELTHIRRYDLWVNLLQRLAETLLFFNPAMWFLSRRISVLREFCCDEFTCRGTTHADAQLRTRYASALLRVAELSQRSSRDALPNELLTLAAAGRSPSELRRRIAHLFGEPIREPLGLSRGSVLALITASAVLLAGPALWQSKSDTATAQVTEVPKVDDPVDQVDPAPNRFELLVRGPDGQPVSRARVEVRADPKPTVEQVVIGTYLRPATYGPFVQTNEQGRLVLELPKQPKRFNLSINAYGYGPYWAGWSGEEQLESLPARFVAELDSGWSVGGVVVDEQGEPIAGAKVHPFVHYKKRPGDTDRLGVGGGATTDAQGEWRYNNVPGSKTDVTVEINHPEYMPSRPSLSRSQFGVPLVHEPAERIELKRGLTVTGRVTDGGGQPIVGALLRTKFINNIRKATTDANGEYRLNGCEPRMARIVVSAEGKAVDMRDVRVGPDLEPVHFQMQPGGTVRVRVINEKGNPIPKARIFFQEWRGDRYEYFEFDHVDQYADENGIWEWHEAPHDEFKADICRPGGMQLSSQSLTARDAEYVFTPPRKLVVSGRVVDANTKKPIKTFRVTPGLRNPDPSIRMNWIPSESFEATDGRYRVRFSHDYPGHLVRIEAEGYKVAISRDIMTDEGEVDFDFALQPAVDIAATILTVEGEPAGDAKIALGVAGSQINIEAGDIEDDSTYATQLEADAKGRFRIPARDEPFQLVITHPAGYAHLKSSDGPIPESITLVPWARVEGTFRVGPNVAPGVVLSWFGEGIHSYGNKTPNIFSSHDVTTGDAGQFVFDRVFPGRGKIGRRIMLMVDDGATEVTSSIHMPAEFVPGETITLNLGGTGRAVIGQLVPPSSFKKQVLWNFALVNVQADLDAPKNPPEPPDDVVGDPEQYKAWWATWTNTDEGRAWTRDNLTYQRLREESPSVTATVDRDGSFRIDDMPAGKYVLTARFNKQAAGVLSGYSFEVPIDDPDRNSEPLDLGLLPLKAE